MHLLFTKLQYEIKFILEKNKFIGRPYLYFQNWDVKTDFLNPAPS